MRTLLVAFLALSSISTSVLAQAPDSLSFQGYVTDSLGNPIADGVLERGEVSFVTGTSGVGPDGTIVYVFVGGEVVAVTDPEWDWD